MARKKKTTRKRQAVGFIGPNLKNKGDRNKRVSKEQGQSNIRTLEAIRRRNEARRKNKKK